MQPLLLINMNTLKFARQLAMLALLAASSLASATEAEERGAVRDQAAESYRAGDFSELEKQHSLYSNFFEQRTSSGAFKMTLFFDGIGAAMREADEKELQNDIARTKSWVNSQRASPLAHVLHARALLSYGAYFRGGGFANTVPPQAWKVYEEFTRKAGTYLIENEQVASRSTSWHAWMLNIARIAGMPQEAIQRVFLAGLSVNSADYRLYRNALEYALPKWHGSPEAVDAFVQMAVKSAPPKYGSELYARLYSASEQDQFGRRLYEDSLVDWKQMKEGLTAWAQNFPTQCGTRTYSHTMPALLGTSLLQKSCSLKLEKIPSGTSGSRAQRQLSTLAFDGLQIRRRNQPNRELETPEPARDLELLGLWGVA